jgi:peroxiredoxin Q/BCP
MLKIHDKAPQFSLYDQNSEKRQLADAAGHWLLLYFYPKDNTPGCTTEACTLRDAWQDLRDLGVIVWGVSADSVKSHQGFAEKFHLPFPILADTEKKVLTDYAVLGERSMFGKTFLGIRRMSFLIDPEGKIAKIYEKVSPAKHAAEVIKDVQRFQKA